MKRILAGILALTLAACAGKVPGRDSVPVEFRAPSEPDAEVMPLLHDVIVLGVITETNIEPQREVDIERIMGRLADATARGLRNLPDRRVVSQDELRWHFKDRVLDSLSVFSDSLQQQMREELELDALVYVSLRGMEAHLTPVSPGPRGTAVRSPGMSLTVELEMTLLNLDTGDLWTQRGKRSSWEPVQKQNTAGGGDGTEQQLLTALAGPMRDFLARVSPPPRRQQRKFDTSGD
ncbi:MAG: hypothetical protein HN712_21760 [Gemmatimonadetes bacterium]|jgi:hypothetical protein|nr:hypothetical protein [Gemmatimonadota bacterium]MBT6144334.1 hypothetical protein [Gemmatimonadota bacterium]MBT7862954.1 hypothetical protein [Gemmatimonadota bacterium]